MFRMTFYFSSKLNVLDMCKNILLLLDIQATIQFLFHNRDPRAILFIVYLDLLIFEYAIRFRLLSFHIHN